MSADLPEIDEADHLLAQAVRMDFAFARHVQQRALETDEPKDLADLARAYTRLTRSMRQNLALLTKQKADREKQAREREAHETLRALRMPERDLRELAVEERTEEVQAAVDRVISAAAAGDEQLHTDWAHRFDREVDDWTEDDDWITDDVDAVIARACRTLGLPDDLAARWRDLPDPTFFPDPEEDADDDEETNAAAREATARFRAAADPHPTDPDAPPIPWRNSG